MKYYLCHYYVPPWQKSSDFKGNSIAEFSQHNSKPITTTSAYNSIFYPVFKLSKLHLLLFSALFIIISCSSVSNKENMNFTTISIGRGGGATGIITGFTVNSKGLLSSWEGREINDNIAEISNLTTEKLMRLNAIVMDNNLLNYTYQEPYNFYYLIKITHDTTYNYIVWNPNANEESTIFLNRIFKEIIDIIEN
jgi:hypothetical protein